MTLKFLLDTTIVSDPVAKIPNRRVLRKLEQHGIYCAIAAPVWHELVYGCSRLPAGKRRSALEEYLHGVVKRSFPILPYDDGAAEWHGRQRARLEAGGKISPFVDGQIAAIAHDRSLTLVTANTEDFRHFDELELADWTR
jgi:tRNA(fMet)-specific endonuclease VapC